MTAFPKLSVLRDELLRTEKTRLLARGSLISIVMRFGGMGLRLLSGILIARLMGATAYGVYAYALTWLIFLTVPTMMGLDHTLLRYISSYREKRDTSALRGLLRFSTRLALAATIIGALGAAALVAALPTISSELRWTLWIMFAILPIVVLSQTRQSTLRGFDESMRALLPEQILYPGALVAFGLVAYFWLHLTISAPQMAIVNAGAWLVAFGVGSVFLKKTIPAEVREAPIETRQAEWAANIPFLVVSVGAYHLLARVDLVILAAMRTSAEVGIYTVAARAAELVFLPYDAVTLAGASLASALLASGDKAELQRFTTLVSRIILVVGLPMYAAFFVGAPWVLGIFGPTFVGGAAAFRMLLTTNLLSSLTGFVIISLYNLGEQRRVAVWMGVCAILNAILTLVLVGPLGLLGAAIAAGVSLVLLKAALVGALFRRNGILSLPITPRGARGRTRGPP